MSDENKLHLAVSKTPHGIIDTSRFNWEQLAAASQSKCGKDTDRRVFSHVSDKISSSHLSLDNDCGVTDVVIAEWLHINRTDAQFEVQIATKDLQNEIENSIARAKNTVEVFASAQFDFEDDWENFIQLLARPKSTDRVLKRLISGAKSAKSTGICLDISSLPSEQAQAFLGFLSTASSTFSKAGLQSCLIGTVEQDFWKEFSVSQGFDWVILHAFRTPWLGSTPQYLADNDWFKAVVKQTLQKIDAQKLVIALGGFSIDWTSGQPIPQQMSYAETMAKIALYNGKLVHLPEVGNTYARFLDLDGKLHKVWMLDAASAQNQVAILETLGVSNIGVWSLGMEDPSIWSVLSSKPSSTNLLKERLAQVNLDNYVHYSGEGPFLDVLAVGTLGTRTIELSLDNRQITSMRYDVLPTPARVLRYGKPAANELILTFDDGPNPDFTPQILDTLKKTGTPATFYVLGNNVLQHPDLIKRMSQEGHELGSHSFSHPRMDQVSPTRRHAEFSSTQALLASTLNQNTLLYREPFLRSGGPISAPRVYSLIEAQNMGQVIGGMDVVPKDWEGWSTEKIVNYVVQEVQQGNGQVILLHDGGENRESTVAAVPKIIDALTSKGYRFIASSKALGVTASDIMPAATGAKPIFARYSFGFISIIWTLAKTALIVVLVIGLFRASMILAFYLKRKRHRSLDKSHMPLVTVLIPAYNESCVINDCVDTVLRSTYPNFSIIVVDDGSTDDTLEKLKVYQNNFLVKVVTQANRGKWAALNHAIAISDGEIVVNIDADTRIDSNAISLMVEHFVNPGIGAVSGKIIVGNRVNILTRLQALEYITAQGFDRLAFDRVNGIMVVSGAIGAWRVSALNKAGLFQNRTLTEDADMTISVLRKGFRVVYDERARAFTEAPTTIRALMTQRLRWSLGMFQTAWCHKRALLETNSMCRLTILDMLIFGYLLPILAPVADLLVVVLIYNLLSGSWTGVVGTAPEMLPFGLIAAYMVLPLVDFLLAFVALKKDKDEGFGLLWLFPLQRFFYRQLLYLSIFRAINRAVTGTLSNWGKGKRTGMASPKKMRKSNG